MTVNGTVILVFKYTSKLSNNRQVAFDESYVEFLFPSFLRAGRDRKAWLEQRLKCDWRDRSARLAEIETRRFCCPGTWLLWANACANAYLRQFRMENDHNAIFINLTSNPLRGKRTSADTLSRKANALLRAWARSATRPAPHDDSVLVPWFDDQRRAARMDAHDWRSIVTGSLARRGMPSHVLNLRASWASPNSANRFASVARNHYLDATAGVGSHVAELLFLPYNGTMDT